MSSREQFLIYWCRRDFRLEDNPALYAAIQESQVRSLPLVSLFILEDYMTQGDPKYQFGYPSRFFLSKALPKFSKKFDQFYIIRGKAAQTLITLSREYDIVIYVNEDVHPDFYTQLQRLKNAEVKVRLFTDQMTAPREIQSGSGKAYSVFTPFKKAIWKIWIRSSITPECNPQSSHKVPQSTHSRLSSMSVPADENALLQLFATDRKIAIADTIIDLSQLVSTPNLSAWYWDETEARKRFSLFIDSNRLSDYKQNRDSLELDTKENASTSKMSLALTWGLLSARILRKMITDHFDDSFEDLNSSRSNQGALTYLSELVWREFYKYVFFHQPTLLHTEFQSRFRSLSWEYGAKGMERFLAWIQGTTGYHIVDAAMNQIANTAWMHNRSRMIVASILSKNLGVDWRWGQEYFRAVLIDIDEASNNGGWQWAASTGTDPKPIRIFNPYTQAERHDAKAVYQKRWLPQNYDYSQPPLVEHKKARTLALRRYGLEDKGVRDF